MVKNAITNGLRCFFEVMVVVFSCGIFCIGVTKAITFGHAWQMPLAERVCGRGVEPGFELKNEQFNWNIPNEQTT